MTVHFKVKETVKLSDGDKISIEIKEALFLYHSWLRTEFELIELAHNMLLAMSESENGLVANYEQTDEFKTIESLIKQFQSRNIEDCDSKIRLNCPLTGKFDWVEPEYMPEIYDELIWTISGYISDAYGIEDYYCGFYDGDWGLWPNLEKDGWE